MKHLITATVVVSLVLGLAASSSANPDPVNALVVGKLMRACPRSRVGTRQGCSTQKRAVVSAFNARNRLVARERVTNGHFSFLLRPGRYELNAVVDATHSGSHSVGARAHRSIRANIVIYPHPPCCKH